MPHFKITLYVTKTGVSMIVSMIWGPVKSCLWTWFHGDSSENFRTSQECVRKSDVTQVVVTPQQLSRLCEKIWRHPTCKNTSAIFSSPASPVSHTIDTLICRVKLENNSTGSQNKENIHLQNYNNTPWIHWARNTQALFSTLYSYITAPNLYQDESPDFYRRF